MIKLFINSMLLICITGNMIELKFQTLHNKEISDFLKEYEKLKARNAVDKSPSVTYPLMFGWLKKALDKFAYRFSAVTFK